MAMARVFNSASLRFGFGLATAVAAMAFPMTANAQSFNFYIECVHRTPGTVDKVWLSRPISAHDSSSSTRQEIVNAVKGQWDSRFPEEKGFKHECFWMSTDPSYISGDRVTDFNPSLEAIPQSMIRTLTLDFEPGDGSGFLHARRGYRRASIKLNYRFLLCANEIQMAYALDRKSLEHSGEYVDRFNGPNPNTMVPNSEPPVPMTVPLAVKIVRAVPGTPYVATIRDETAGEALGMSCFTGQTARVGFVAKLIGPQATRPQIKAFIDTLRADEITPGASLGYALINPDVPAPPAAAPRPRAPAHRKTN
jgi:hypothetical protein